MIIDGVFTTFAVVFGTLMYVITFTFTGGAITALTITTIFECLYWGYIIHIHKTEATPNAL